MSASVTKATELQRLFAGGRWATAKISARALPTPAPGRTPLILMEDEKVRRTALASPSARPMLPRTIVGALKPGNSFPGAGIDATKPMLAIVLSARLAKFSGK